MVDAERVARLLNRVSADIETLHAYRDRRDQLPTDLTLLSAVKYNFITVVEGCARVAQHMIASQGWPAPETNADAVRRLAREGVIDAPTAEAVAKAVGFRNVLVHEYMDVDDGFVVGNLNRLEDLERFVGQVAAWTSHG